MAVDPSEKPEHPTGQHHEEQPNNHPSHKSAHLPNEPRDEEDTTRSGSLDSWADTSWSGTQSNQAHVHANFDAPRPQTGFIPEQPESLRGRADSLMDEMMLGAIDLSAGGPASNGLADADRASLPPTNEYGQPQPQYDQPQYDQPQYDQPQFNPQQDEYMADLGGPTNAGAQPPTDNARPTHQSFDSTPPPNVNQVLNQPPANELHSAPSAQPPFGQALTPQEPSGYPTVSQELSNQSFSNASQVPNLQAPNLQSAPAPAAGADPLYGQQPPVGSQPSAPQGQLYPPSSAGGVQASSQSLSQPPLQPPSQSALQPPAYQPPRSSFSYSGASTPQQQSGSYSFGGPSSTEQSGMSYFEQQRLSYAERYAFEREQERKQWSIATGRANDYLTSVPRYPRESRDELGQPSCSPYNPASSQTPQSRYPSGQYSPGQYSLGQYSPGEYPPAPNPASYPPSQYSSGQYPSGQHPPEQYQQPYPQQPNPYPNAQPPQNYQQGQYAQPAGYRPNVPPPYQGHIPELGPVIPGQQHTSPFADAMSVGSQARQMDLLPRETKMNVQALQEEMLSLHTNIDTSLPIGHDIADRARHLLDKGRAILEQDPYRSAEVSYYVQQVKAILERAKQRTKWSNMYRTRLLYYLLGWFFLSITALASVMIYSDQLRSFFAPLGVDPNTTILGQHGVPFLATIAAGALGASIAALLNMWRYSQRDYGFFDRKYGLLGVVLPIISLLFGTVVYLIFGFIAELFNIPPSSNLLISVVPAVIAFAFGAAQERIYGTSE